jgi:hypothetical protein
MGNSVSGTIVAGLAALAMLSAAVVLPATPASSGGWAGGRVWHPGYWRGGYWYNGWWGPAVATGMLAGIRRSVASSTSLCTIARKWCPCSRRRGTTCQGEANRFYGKRAFASPTKS